MHGLIKPCKKNERSTQMHNCSTDIMVLCNRGCADEISKSFKKWYKDGITLKEVLDRTGVSFKAAADPEYDGIVDDFYAHKGTDTVFISVRTEERPLTAMWKEIFDKCFPGKVSGILYTSQNKRRNIFYSNRPEEAEKYIVHWHIPGEKHCKTEYTAEEFTDVMLKFLGQQDICPDKTDANSLMDEVNYLDLGADVSKYTFADVRDLK